MKAFKKFLALGAVLAASSSFAFADSIQVSGGDSFNATGITFNPSTGIVSNVQDDNGNLGGLFAPFFGQLASLTSFNYSPLASANGVTVFSSTITGETISFRIDELMTQSIGMDNNGQTLNLSGYGTFTAVGAINQVTAGTFSLSSSAARPTNLNFGFQIIAAPNAVTPEPNSLVLLGSGLVGAAGMLFMRRRNAEVL